jgi:hypothetical protein
VKFDAKKQTEILVVSLGNATHAGLFLVVEARKPYGWGKEVNLKWGMLYYEESFTLVKFATQKDAEILVASLGNATHVGLFLVVEARNPYWRGRLSTVELLALTNLDQLLLTIQTIRQLV